MLARDIKYAGWDIKYAGQDIKYAGQDIKYASLLKFCSCHDMSAY
jgi:hypothetical protein